MTFNALLATRDDVAPAVPGDRRAVVDQVISNPSQDLRTR